MSDDMTEEEREARLRAIRGMTEDVYDRMGAAATRGDGTGRSELPGIQRNRPERTAGERAAQVLRVLGAGVRGGDASAPPPPPPERPSEFEGMETQPAYDKKRTRTPEEEAAERRQAYLDARSKRPDASSRTMSSNEVAQAREDSRRIRESMAADRVDRGRQMATSAADIQADYRAGRLTLEQAQQALREIQDMP